MKKLIAIALVLSLVAAFVPAALAAVPATTKTFQKTMQENNAIEVGGADYGAYNGRQVNTVQNSDLSNINKNMMDVKASELENKGTWQEDVTRFGVELMDQEDTLLMGYEFKKTDFALCSDFFTDQECLGMVVMPNDPTTQKARTFEQGEGLFFNYDLIKSFSGSEITYLDENLDVQLGVYMFAGTYDDFYGEGEGGGLKMSGSWVGNKSASIKVVAPEDNYVYMFFIAVMDTKLAEFGAWMPISNYANDYKDLKATETVAPGATVKTELGSADTTLILDNMFHMSYAKAYKVELKAGDEYAAVLDSEDSLGGKLILCDENMDAISTTYIGSGAVAAGTTYAECPLPILPVVDGTYYIILEGFYMADVGQIEFTLGDFADSYKPLNPVDIAIDVEDLGTTDIGDPTTDSWIYRWYADASIGTLSLVYPGTYTLTGSNTNVTVDLYDAVSVVLDNATIGSLWLANTWASAEVCAKGSSEITDNGTIKYTVYNYEGSNAGVYFTGETLNVEGPLGVLIDNAPVHINVDNFTATAVGLTGSFAIATWVTGTLSPKLTFNNPTFDAGLKACTMYADAAGHFLYGYTVSEQESVYRYGGGTPDFTFIAPTYTVHCSEGANVLFGDANQDGKVNTGDATTVLKHTTGASILAGNGLAAADMNKDGKVNTGDATAILKHCVAND